MENKYDYIKKYNYSNIQNTYGKMKKAFPYLREHEKFNTNIKKYFYDFEILKDYVPECIFEEIIDKAMEQTNILNCLSISDAINRENGKQYYINIDYKPIKVFKQSTGKFIYSIMIAKAIRISIYDINIYGYTENKSSYKEIGNWNTSCIVPIEHIEIN